MPHNRKGSNCQYQHTSKRGKNSKFNQKRKGCSRKPKKAFKLNRRRNKYTDRSGFYSKFDDTDPMPRYKFNDETIEHKMPHIIRSFLRKNSINDYELIQFGSSIYRQYTDVIDSDNVLNDLDFGIKLPEKYNCYSIKFKFKSWMYRHCHIWTSSKDRKRPFNSEPPDYMKECSFIKIYTYGSNTNVDVGFVHSVEYNLGSPAFAHEALTHNLDSGITFSRINFVDTNLILQYLERGETFQLVSDSYYTLKRRRCKCQVKGLTIVEAPNIFNECSICLNKIKLDKHVKLDCSHCFHMNCLDKWRCTLFRNQQHQTCPMCRIELNSSNQEKFYFHAGYC